jgi:predicted nucleic acid-binding Zn ribbon protein
MKQAKTRKLDELVNLYLKQAGLDRKFKEMEACRAWPEVVGQAIAARTTEVSAHDGRLFVRFSSPVVRNEMAMVKEGVIKVLNERLGGDVVREIIFR